jgi:hypothetical protein
MLLGCVAVFDEVEEFHAFLLLYQLSDSTSYFAAKAR